MDGKQMQLSKSEERIISLLDTAVDRLRMTSDICDVLQRLHLYHENSEILKKIDSGSVLLDDLEHLLHEDYERARLRLSASLLERLDKLSMEGRDVYWTNGKPELALDPDVLPWRD